MEILEALTIVRKLANGVHPETGELLQSDCVYNHPQAVRALHRAVGALEFQDERERTKKFLPGNAGKPWTNQEDAQICEEIRRGMSFEQIAQIHSRTNGSIVARLVRLGKISGWSADAEDYMKYAQHMRLEIALGLLLLALYATAQVGAPRSALQRKHDQLARERWSMAGRRVSGSSAALRHQAIQQKLLMRSPRSLATQTAGISGAWVSLGPLPLPSDASGLGLQDYSWVSGRATAVAIDPNDPTGNTVYAGGAYGGVWKSTNAGNLSPSPLSVNWTALTDNQPTLAIGAIAVQPQLANPDPAKSLVLAGTGETNSSGDSYYGLGILRSPDGGQTWTLISQDSTGTHPLADLDSVRLHSVRVIGIWLWLLRVLPPRALWKVLKIR